MEPIIVLAIVNLIALLAFGRGATRSVAGYFRLLIVVAFGVGAAGVIAAVTGETRMTGSITSQVAASLLLLALASALTVTIATVRFAIAAVAALVAVINDRRVEEYLAAARKAEATRPWSSFPAWCRAEARKHEAAAKAAARWLYAE